MAALFGAGAAVNAGLVAAASWNEPGMALGAEPPRAIELPANPQRLGDAAKGHEYLLYGDYIGSGIPEALFGVLSPPVAEGRRVLERAGPSASLPHNVNRFEMPSGVAVVAGLNCLGCHASMFNGELVIGLGNSLADFDGGHPVEVVAAAGNALYPPGSAERAAMEQYLRGARALAGEVSTPFRGLNPAFRIEEVAASHRRPEDLSWSDEPVFEPNEGTVASDVPAWWLLKKKNALYYLGLGRGDFVRSIQQITVVAIEDEQDAARIAESMRDLLAYLVTIEPPKHPGPIDMGLARAGEGVFVQNCAKCHGTYDTFGGPETYPNRLIPLERIGTDPGYAQNLMASGLWAWFNQSWYSKTADDGGESTAAAPLAGYVAPPLDGVWITAPYFHNGSVPTVEGVLDSAARPTFWRRSFRDDDYDLDRLGWRHTVEPGPGGRETYDTTVPGYGNGGHPFGDELTPEERRAVIEYLKTL